MGVLYSLNLLQGRCEEGQTEGFPSGQTAVVGPGFQCPQGFQYDYNMYAVITLIKLPFPQSNQHTATQCRKTTRPEEYKVWSRIFLFFHFNFLHTFQRASTKQYNTRGLSDVPSRKVESRGLSVCWERPRNGRGLLCR